MGLKDQDTVQDQLDQHSLPGTNQAGKGPGAREENALENGPDDSKGQRQDQLEEHSLPGTNPGWESPAERRSTTARLRRT